MDIKITVSMYKPDANQPFFEAVADDFDELRTGAEGPIYVVTMPDGTRIFMHVTTEGE